MKAQLSLEFLLNFLVFLIFISTLSFSLISLANYSKANAQVVKARLTLEEDARVLDLIEINGFLVYYPKELSKNLNPEKGIIRSDVYYNESIFAYTIYKSGVNNVKKEPI